VHLQRSTGGAFTTIGSDATDASGNWKVNTTPQVNAKYKATVVAKGACTTASSKTLTARQTKSSIAIGSLGNSFKGKITSVSDCVNGRTVKLQRSTGGGAFQNVGTPDTSSSNGSWEVATDPVNNAQYRANVGAKTVGTDACMATVSTITTARNSSVSIQQGGSTNFHGTVTSIAACESNRTVTLQRKTIYETTFHNIGSDATSPTGVWQVNTAVVSGASYRASVAAKQAGANSCLDALSNVRVAS